MRELKKTIPVTLGAVVMNTAVHISGMQQIQSADLMGKRAVKPDRVRSRYTEEYLPLGSNILEMVVSGGEFVGNGFLLLSESQQNCYPEECRSY